MNKIIATCILWFGLIVTFSSMSPAMAESIAPQQIEVYHSETFGNTAMGKEVYRYRTLVGKDNQADSIVEVTQPPQYDGFLLRKHVIQNPEEMYVLNGEFEVVFSEKNEKIEVSTGDLVKIPASLPFGFRHLNKGIGEIKIVSYGDRLPKMLAEIGTLKQDTSGDFGAIAAIASKYGIEYLN